MATGVTVIFATEFVFPELVTLKAEIFPVPDDDSPMDELSLVQLKTVFGTAKLEEKDIKLVDSPLHNEIGLNASTVGFGLIVITNDVEAPEHPLAEGVTEIVLEIGPLVLFCAVKLPILPVPFEAVKPIDVLELLQV